MNNLEKMRTTGIVPVVVLEDASNAIQTAKALLDGS
ncbi:hypothetical protein EDD59_10275 [Muricomes intestini]|uniref:Uncharacterized protein n=1 Tax=Muricomes intestini TaxID=1796634 RepID=A0A4V2USP2_9FIRM|nr:hypothetical protein EDD59_10275 [Muricomes intestini]